MRNTQWWQTCCATFALSCANTYVSNENIGKRVKHDRCDWIRGMRPRNYVRCTPQIHDLSALSGSAKICAKQNEFSASDAGAATEIEERFYHIRHCHRIWCIGPVRRHTNATRMWKPNINHLFLVSKLGEICYLQGKRCNTLNPKNRFIN